MKKLYSNLPGIIFGILVICFLIGFSVLAWTEPTQAPPQGNVPAPINVGNIDQYKTGRIGAYTNGIDTNYGLTVGSGATPQGLKATGNSYFQNNLYIMGNVGIGTTNPGTNRLEVVGGPIKATDGLIIETRTSDPATPATGQMWLRTDI